VRKVRNDAFIKSVYFTGIYLYAHSLILLLIAFVVAGHSSMKRDYGGKRHIFED
jgi:hypothetical protein